MGTSKDTSQFCCDNIAYWWQSELQWKYPDANCLLLLCDGGGSNNSKHYIVKQGLYHLAQLLDINIIVAQSPPYCSKWNPIEHRLFCHVHRSSGNPFHLLFLLLFTAFFFILATADFDEYVLLKDDGIYQLTDERKGKLIRELADLEEAEQYALRAIHAGRNVPYY